MTNLADLLGGKTGKHIGTPKLKLTDWTVTHDSIDDMEFKNFVDDSPRFKKVAVEDAPAIPPNVPDPPDIDFTTATREEIVAWQAEAQAAKAARDAAPPYANWTKLARDVFTSYHTHDQPDVIDAVDPSVALHQRILPKLLHQDEHAKSRNATRDDATMAAMATTAAVNVLKDMLGDELVTQAQEAEEYREHAEQAGQHYQNLVDLRGQAQGYRDAGQPVPGDLVGQIRQAVKDKRAAQAAAAAAAAQQTPMSGQALEAIETAAQAGQAAADAAGCMPSFGAGFGAGEPTYESPEQALSIAEMWSENESLRKIAELFGRCDREFRFLRATRVVGGNDELVDIAYGDNLARVLPSELALFGDDETELDFLTRYAAGELLVFTTEGEAHSGRGPIVIVLDGSGSMQGTPNIWARAITLCLLNIARIEKRDFGVVEFSSGGQTKTWEFRAKAALKAEDIVDVCSHFFGGGTTPINGVTAAVKLMDDSAPFKMADLVMVGDGNAGYGPEDERLRTHLVEKGVRLFGLGIGGPFDYLARYCDSVVDVHQFELQDPGKAVAELATHVS
jgi:uncharacterized protein with von Willebrand factor type A (vWA) domain